MKPFFQVYKLVANGPDDCEWELDSEYEELKDATYCMACYEEKGYQTKLFDPYVGEYYTSAGQVAPLK